MTIDDDDPFARGGDLFGWELPADAREVLLEGLRSPDPVARREAVGMLWDSMDDELAAEALRLAHEDEDPEIAALAAGGLAPALRAAARPLPGGAPLSAEGAARVVEGLRRVYHDSAVPAEVRRRALEAAIHGPGTWQEGAVRAAWAGSDPAWRATAVFCMGHRPGLADEVLAALDDPEPGVRFEAARAAAGARLAAAGPRVTALATAPDEVAEVRIAAIEALMALRPPAVVAALERVAAEASGEVSEVAREALADLRGEEEDLEPV